MHPNTIVIVEAEFLIALDIQRILERTHPDAMVRVYNIHTAIDDNLDLGGIGLAIVDLHSTDAATYAFVVRLAAAGVPVVATSTDPGLAGVAGHEHIPMVRKPFAEADLIAACALVLAGSGAAPNP